MFGEERLEQVIAERALSGAEQLEEPISLSVKDFVREQRQNDDLTLLIVE